MLKYIVKRLLQLIPVLIGITFLSFAMMRLAGGDAVTYMYENAGTAVSQEVIDEAKKEYGLDQRRNDHRGYGRQLCVGPGRL